MTTESSLLSLPGELRKKIYRYAVVEVDPIIPTIIKSRCRDSKRYTFFLKQPQPTLAATCRLLRGEVLPIYYGENVSAPTAQYRRTNSGIVS